MVSDSQCFEKIQTALVSFGMSGRLFHAPFIERHGGFELKLILERSKSLSKTKYPKALIVRDFEDVLSNESIELVIINTPSYLHFEMCKAVLLAGKNVVVEKPFVVNSVDGEELIELAKEKKLLLTVYHNKRLEGDFLSIKKMLAENALGSLESVEINSFRYNPNIGIKKWKEGGQPGGGLLYDIGSHLIDQALQLFGTPESVTSSIKSQREESLVVDYFKIKLQYSDFKVQLFADFLLTSVLYSLPIHQIIIFSIYVRNYHILINFAL